MTKKIIISALAIVLSFALFIVPSFAKPPIKATMFGAYVGDNSQAWHSVSIMPVNNTTFGLYSSETLELTTQIWMYFDLGVDSVSSFRIHIRKLSTAFQDNTSVGIGSYAMYLWNYNGDYTSGQVSIRTQVSSNRTVNADGTTDYEYIWHKQSDIGDKQVFSFILPFQSFMIGQGPIYFEIVEFSVNGEDVSNVEFIENNADLKSIVERQAIMDEELFNDLYVPTEVISDIITQQGALLGSQYPLILVTQNNFLVPTMLLTVFALAFLGFLLFGKKA